MSNEHVGTGKDDKWRPVRVDLIPIQDARTGWNQECGSETGVACGSKTPIVDAQRLCCVLCGADQTRW